MNAKIMCLIAVVVAATFVSCSSGSGATAPVQVATFADLGECNSYSEGVTKQVASDGQYYKCAAGEWQEAERESNNSETFAGAIPGTVNPANVVKDSFTDFRDGQIYKTVTIGAQTWMAQNLNYKTANSYCGDDDNDAIYCNKYGRLYTWMAATTACPSGWHLPSEEEWKTLVNVVGGSFEVMRSSTGWSGDFTDPYGFSVLPGGYRYIDCPLESCYGYEGYCAAFWSDNHDYRMYLYNSEGEIPYLGGDYKPYAFSVRCVKD